MQSPPTGQPTSTGPAAHTDPELLTLLTVEAAARRLSIGRTTMYALLKTGRVSSVRIGRLRRIPAPALTEYTKRLTTGQQAV